MVGRVWWEVRRGERKEGSLYVGWKPLTGALPGDMSEVTFATLAHHRAVVHRRGQAPQGTVLASFHDRILPSPPPAPPWILPWRIYTDGSWKPDLSPTPDDYFWEPGTNQGGGCIVVTQDTED